MPKANIKKIASRRIFVSYCHADYFSAKRLYPELEAMARRYGDSAIFLDSGGDSRLMAGDAWKSKIMAALESANVFVVLMSTDFHASPFCREVELRRMLERRMRETHAKVIGIALHEVNLENFSIEIDGMTVGLEELQCIPQGMIGKPVGARLGLKPISGWRNHRDAWVTVVKQIEEALREGERPLFVEHAGEHRDNHTPAAPPGNPIAASYLPYLCNRDEQYDALLASLDHWRTSNFSRPLVLITEGRNDDCLGKWIDRLRQHEIAKALGFDQLGLSFGHFKPFRWPSAMAALPSLADARQRFVRALADALSPDPLAPEAKFFDAHLTRARPTLLWVDCADSSGPEHARRALEGLLAVLDACPPLSQRTMLVVAVNIIREPGAPASERARLAQDFEDVLGQAIAALRVRGAMLGSLPELDESAISIWSSHEKVSGKLIDDIEMLCTRLPAGRTTWPMRTFAEVARQWFKSA